MNYKKNILIYLLMILPSHIEPSRENIYENMLRPIEYSKIGMRNFLSDIYNHHLYKDFLGSCFVHILDLFEYAHVTSHSGYFIQQVLQLFIQKLYSVDYINPYAFLYFLQQSCQTMLLLLSNSKNNCCNEIETILKTYLLNEFQLLQTNSKEFLEKSSKAIYEKIINTVHDDIYTQYMYNLFIEIISSKIVFDFTERDDTLDCFKQLIASIVYQYENKILADQDTLHRILWAVCCQFKASFSLQKHQINIIDQDKIKYFILRDCKALEQYEEVEGLITKKTDFLMQMF